MSERLTEEEFAKAIAESMAATDALDAEVRGRGKVPLFDLDTPVAIADQVKVVCTMLEIGAADRDWNDVLNALVYLRRTGGILQNAAKAENKEKSMSDQSTTPCRADGKAIPAADLPENAKVLIRSAADSLRHAASEIRAANSQGE